MWLPERGRSGSRRSRTRGRSSPAPSLGEHTDDVLAEVGYSTDEIAALWDAVVVSNRLAS